MLDESRRSSARRLPLGAAAVLRLPAHPRGHAHGRLASCGCWWGSPDDARAVLAEIRAAAGPHGRWQAMHELADGLRRGNLNLDGVPTAGARGAVDRLRHSSQGVSPADREQAALTRSGCWPCAVEARAGAHGHRPLGAVRRGRHGAALGARRPGRDARPGSREALVGVLQGGSDEERFIALAALGLAVGGDGAAADAVGGPARARRRRPAAQCHPGPGRRRRRAPPRPAGALVRANYDGDVSLGRPDAALRDEDSRAAALTVVEQSRLGLPRRRQEPRPGKPAAAAARAGGRRSSLKVRSAALGTLHAAASPRRTPDGHHRSQPACDRRAEPGAGHRAARRSFGLGRGGWVLFATGAGAGLLGCVRFLFPNVLFEPPSNFKAGFPRDIALGVDERYKETNGAWLVRALRPASDRTGVDGIYALSTTCTHLRVHPQLAGGGQQVQCPCHGSGFRMSGINFEDRRRARWSASASGWTTGRCWWTRARSSSGKRSSGSRTRPS